MSTPTINAPEFVPGDTSNGHVLTASGVWTPVVTAPPKKSTGKIVAAVLAAVVLLGVGGIAVAAASGTDSLPQQTSVSQPTDASGLTAAEAEFVLGNEDQFGDMPAAEEQSYVDLGWTVCTSLDNGMSVATIGDIAMSNGFTPAEAANLVVGAAYDLCPANIDVVDAAVASANSTGSV